MTPSRGDDDIRIRFRAARTSPHTTGDHCLTSGVWSLVTVGREFGDCRHPSVAPSKRPSPRAHPLAPKSKSRINSFSPNLERLATMGECIFAIPSSKIFPGNDRSSNLKRYGHIFFRVSFGIGVPSDLTAAFSVNVVWSFYSALPSEGELSLNERHLIGWDIWLPRHDEDLKQERAKRRKGRPKSIKEVQIEEPKVWEAEEYKTGLGSSLHLDEPKRIVTHLFFVFRSRGA